MKREIRAFSLVFGVVIFLGVSSDLNNDIGEKYYNGFRALDMIVPIPESEYVPPPTPTPNMFRENLVVSVDEIAIEYTDIELEYIGTYYITAYCPWECGYNGENFPKGWSTASGTICHRADYENRITEPTTCAVDPRIHSIWGETYFYIPEFDRVFVAEDTGSAVKGYHLDLFYEDYDVSDFPTGYYDVYSVEYVTKTIEVKDDENSN